jgi:hypothetical protein
MPGAGSVTSWHYIDGLIDLRGRIRCVFSPIELVLSGKNSSGPLALFVRLFTLPDSKNTENRKPISNTAGVWGRALRPVFNKRRSHAKNFLTAPSPWIAECVRC